MDDILKLIIASLFIVSILVISLVTAKFDIHFEDHEDI